MAVNQAAAVPFAPATTLRRITGQSTTQLTIPARTGYRHVLYDVFLTYPLNYGYVDIAVGTRTYMRIPLGAGSSFTVAQIGQKFGGKGFLSWLAALVNAEDLLPNAAEDEDINITVSSAVTRIDAYYSEIKPEDVSSHNVLGGSDSPRKLFIEVLQPTLTATGNGQNGLVELMPTGLGLLDTNGRVKATTKFTMYTLFADYVASGANYTEYSRLHLFNEDEELFTPVNHEGLFIDKTVTPYTDLYLLASSNEYFIVNPPYTFEPNREVSVLLDVPAVTGSGSAIQIGLIGIRERVG